MHGTGGHHWRELLVLLHRDPKTAGRRLRWPCPVPLPEETVLDTLHDLARRNHLTPLLNRHLLSALALPKSNPPHPGKLPLAPALPGVPQETLIHALWTCLPILTCQGSKAFITWLLLGRRTEQQGCVFIGEPQPETSSREAASTALAASGCYLQSPEYGFVAVPLQHPADPPLTGGSLALPLALGMRLLDQEKHWPQGVYASGGLTADGRILAISGETLKYGLVAHDMRLLLYPETGLLDTIPDAKVARCADLSQAFFVLDCLLAGANAAEILLYRACLAKPTLFLDQCASLPLGLLQAPTGRELLQRIGRERHQLLADLARCLMSCHNDPSRAALFADLFSAEEIATIARQESDEAFDARRWCVARIACANRIGAVAESQAWIKLSYDLAELIDIEKQIDCANHAFVANRFNRYEFRPQPPDDFARYLDLEQRRYEIDRRDNRALGAMYGTLAQNYGFCGQAYRQQFTDCILRAEAAFGFGEYRRERQRLLAYQIYWSLDGAEYDQAKELLNRYLELPSGSPPPRWVDAVQNLWNRSTEHIPFQMAIVCRLLAELSQGGYLSPEPAWCQSLVAFLPGRLSHPWQMTARNLGQLFLAVGLEEQGRAFLHRSVEACAAGGITMIPMALLALATLHQFQPENAKVSLAATEVLQTIRTSTLLHQPHFQPLLDAPTIGEALARIFVDPGRYFPFSYR